MHSSPGPLRPSLALLGLLGAGCSAPVVDDIADAALGSTQAIVLVERVAATDGATQTNVSAKFMRLEAHADPEMAEWIVGGSRLDLPAAGECTLLSFGSHDEAPALSTVGSIELLDVGDLTIRAGEIVMPLAARAFPDVGDLVSGVFYTSRDAASDLPVPAAYLLQSSGAPLFERFAVEAEAPRALEGVAVGESPLDEGIVLEAGTAAVVHWLATREAATEDYDDLIYVEVTAPSGSAVRCAYLDEGEGIIPASFLREDVWGTLPASATIAVHRVRQGSFTSSGIDLGELRFDLSVIGPASITGPRRR
jgi:hypothetical protein